jgi:hypothetical protein
MTLARQFRVYEVRFAEPDAQVITCVGPKNRGSQYRLRSLGAMHLPDVPYMLEPWLAWWP